MHPANELLIAYGLGKLSGDESTEVEGHLTQCETCCQVVAEAADDPLVAQIRAQQPKLGPSPPVPKAERQEARPLPGPLPAQLGDYRLLRVLRSGGMGTVFLAEDVRLRRQVAVKIMRPEIALNPQARQRFFREARAVASLEHDHIVTVYHVGEAQGAPFLVMPLLKGMSLADYLCLGRPWPLGQVLRIGQEIAQGLAAAHERGIIHRDIKPSNLWLGTDGRVKILDFGLARLVEEEEPLTQSGVILGTRTYMAPEQVGGQPVDARADLFGLGCVLYELCTGRPAFYRQTPEAVLAGVQAETPQPARAFNPTVPKALEDLIMNLLAKDPARRPSSAREVGRLLKNIEHQLLSPEKTSAWSGPIAKADGDGGRRPHSALWIAAAVALLLLLPLSYLAIHLIRIDTGKGTLVIETSDRNVQVVVKQGGKQVSILDTKEQKEIKLDTGTYELELAGGPKGLKLSTDRFTLKRDGKEIVRVYLEPSRDAGKKAPRPARTWVKKATLRFAAAQCMAGEINGRIYVVGGNIGRATTSPELQVYDPAKDEWEVRAALPRTDDGQAGRFAGALGVVQGKLYLAGGWRRRPPLPTNTLLIYDPAKDSWKTGTPLPILSGAAVSGVVASKLYVFTPQDGFAYSGQKHFHVYDPATSSWSKLPSPPRYRETMAAGVLDGKLYVVGGADYAATLLAVMDVYDPVTNTWTTAAPLPTPRESLAAAVVGGKLYAVGGRAPQGAGAPTKYLATVEVYDPATNRWTSLPPLSKPRASLVLVAVGRTLYAIGGDDGKGVVGTVEALAIPAAEK